MPFEFTLDFSWIDTLGSKPLYYLMYYFFINGGWILIAFTLIWGFFELFVFKNQLKFASKVKKVYLAIDIPRQNLQGCKAIENIFSALSGAHTPLEWEEKVFGGAFQLGFSLEIVSIDGFIQYIVRTPAQFRDMVESAIYSTYPDAEITEVEDYTKEVTAKFPSDEYNIWGSDLTLYNKECFPIKTYPEFEDMTSKDQKFKDPLITLLEVMNKIKKGEQFWYQIMIWPTDTKWVTDSLNAIKKIIGQPVVSKPSHLDNILQAPMNWLNESGNILLGLGEGEVKKEEKKAMMFLPPAEKIQAEGIARKASKIGFKCKFRIVYFGKKETFNKGLGVSGTFGAIKQFSDLHMNGFKPDHNKTVARWPWFKESRLSLKQNRILKNYKERSGDTGSPKFVLNVEELATIYHFPFFETKGPLVKKIESKKVAAPVGLPFAEAPVAMSESKKPSSAEKAAAKAIDFDEDYFEKRFAKDKTGLADKRRKEELTKSLHLSGAMPDPIQSSKSELEPEAFEDENFTEQFAKTEPEDLIEEADGKAPSAGGKPPTNLPFV